MSRNSDLAWKTDSLIKRTSISHQIARYVLSMEYDSMPPKVVHTAKRILLDTLACAVAASKSPGRPIIENTINALGGIPESTLFGSGKKTSVLNATLLNSYMLRYLDYNDVGGGGHNSECIAALLAVAEREHATPADFLVSIVLSYEIGERIMESIPGGKRGIEAKGWSFDSRAGLNMPPAIGKLMGLNEDQLANAMGISGPFAPTLGVLDTDLVECRMVKNLRFGFSAYQSILACMLAKGGLTGVVNVIEGEKGFRQVVVANEMDLNYIVDFAHWYILDSTSFKGYCMNYANHGGIQAALNLVEKYDIKPEDVEAVKVKTNARVARHTTLVPGKKYARNTENATHSAFFSVAMAIKERNVGPCQLTPDKFEDPELIDLIEKITIEEDASLVGTSNRGAIVEIRTKKGNCYSERVDVPPGHSSTPFSDEEIEEKFRKAARPYMDDNQIQSLIKSVWELEKLDSVEELTRLMVWKEI
ncbi:MmgE/PrpD family protein [Candidatus Formimonas warabiya]|uniref:MmgE/PrpD family protein n=1 Tax=Formimonas warabiya TaxID=1761012 RepID=A0A3G1KTV2_FORW1|nr:MmgE/PrpD family protein [Candidatus Formimonas warabiya]ATW25860.1 hypothetical protein DCMF_14755 [Candidatus Formimonas warabiya]